MAFDPDTLNNALASIDHNTLRGRIRACANIQGFVNLYDSEDFQLCLRCPRIVQGTEDPFEWSREWATRMRDEPPLDVALNECRESLLLLVFELMDRWREMRIPANDIVNIFAGHRFTNILHIAFPMDRALCLFKMRYPRSNSYGMHWIAEQHLDLYPQQREALRQLNGFPTMNMRYLWLVQDPVFEQLNLSSDNEIIPRCIGLERIFDLE